MSEWDHPDRTPLGVVYTGRSTIAVDAFGKAVGILAVGIVTAYPTKCSNKDIRVHLSHDECTTIQLYRSNRRPLSQLSKWEWLFLIVSFVNITFTVGLSISRLISVVREEPDSPDFIFCVLLIANSVFCLVYIFNGLLKELEYEIYMFSCAVAFIVIYCIVEYIVKSDRHNEIKMVRLIMCCILGPINIGLAVYIAQAFGWLEFRIIGASQQMQHMYHQTALFVSFLKFDLQASVSFVILVLQHGIYLDTANIVVLSCGVPFCILWALFGFIVMRHEWKCLAVLFALLGLLSPSYVIYCVTQTFRNLHTPWLMEHKSILYSQFIVGFLTIVVRGALLFEFYFVCKNFSKGLRQRGL